MMRRLFAAMYEKVSKGSEDAGLREERRQLLRAAGGATIEIGAGTGLNVPHYPDGVTRLVFAEPDPPHARAARPESRGDAARRRGRRCRSRASAVR